MSVKDAAPPSSVDDMVVQNVAGGRPIKTAPDTIEITARRRTVTAAVPTSRVLSSRLINPTRFFANGGKRNLNAPAVTYDAATGNAWTATYAGLDGGRHDHGPERRHERGVERDRRGRQPAEATAQETGGNAIAGPTTGCSARLEKVQVAGSETIPRPPDERDGQREPQHGHTQLGGGDRQRRPEGMKLDEAFHVDLTNLPTGAARGHDMLLN